MLRVHELNVCYGGIKAVKGISFEINKGELVCLIGANGAGKTTALRALAGLMSPASGEIYYEDSLINGLPSYELVRRGIALVPEGRGVFGQLTVLENLEMGAYTRLDESGIKTDLDKVFELFPRLKERKTQIAGTLSGGEQQMLALGRALMSRPKLLFLDEPSMGLAPLLVQKIFQTVVQISEEGVTILLVEQNARLALEVSHRGYVMENGKITLSGNSGVLLANSQVKNAYLGEQSP